MGDANIHAGHRERMKEEFRKKGIEHLADYKVLEMLLFYSIPRGDTNETGHRLADTFGTISGVFDAPIELLTETKGVGRESATLIKLVSAIIRAYMDDYASKHNIINDIESAKAYMKYKFLCQASECVYLACLGNNGKVIYCPCLAEGTQKHVEISPSEIVRTALRCNAVKAVLAHNHPNGICTPSSRDLRATSIIYDELRRVDIELTDHIIVAPDGVYSMVENNMFPAHG